eukprot:8039652-Pyramimonas_sp.AAC.1
MLPTPQTRPPAAWSGRFGGGGPSGQSSPGGSSPSRAPCGGPRQVLWPPMRPPRRSKRTPRRRKIVPRSLTWVERSCRDA